VTPSDSGSIEQRSRQLYEEGARGLDARWDDDIGMIRQERGGRVLHPARESLAYAGVLLERGGADNVTRADRIIRTIASMQERRPRDAHYGNVRWYIEDETITDLNGVEFVLDALNDLIRAHASQLSGETRDVILDVIRLGLDEIDALDVHPSYTNIALSDVANSVLGGEIAGEQEYVDRGARRLDEWFEFTNRSGAPHEYNSPTYLAVDIMRMARLASATRDPRIALKARIAEERLWLQAATHYHPALAQLAGPHSRSYRDGWTGAGGYLKLILWKLLGDGNLRRATPYYPKGREEGLLGIAGTEFHCPAYVLDLLREKHFPYETRETTDAAAGADITTYMHGHYALGTASSSYGVGEPLEFSQQPNSLLLYFRREGEPGYGALCTRFVINDKDVAANETDPGGADVWDEGRFAGAQHRNRAIAAYGLMPRIRPVSSYKLSVRVPGAAASDVWIGDRRVERYPAAVEPGEPVVIAAGDAYIAVIPLEPSDMGAGAPIEMKVSEHELVLDIYNYRGPPKTFWEHASQGGAFFKGNVRNAIALEVGSRTDFADVDAFRRHIAGARIADSVDEDYAREIVYSSDGGSVSLRYSLWDMRVIERNCDGVPYAPPMGRAGAVDGSGPQWLHSRDALIELGGARLMAGRAPKWLFTDGDRSRYVFVNPSDEVVPLWLETPRTIIECDAFGFGRVELDEREGIVRVESDEEIASIRLRAPDELRLLVNATDVTSMIAPPDADGVRTFGTPDVAD